MIEPPLPTLLAESSGAIAGNTIETSCDLGPFHNTFGGLALHALHLLPHEVVLLLEPGALI